MKVSQSCPALCDTMDYTIHGIFQARILEWVAIPFSRGSSQPRSPALQADCLPTESQGGSKNTGVGNLSLLQRIFPIQESNQGVLHFRWILCHLSYLKIKGWYIFILGEKIYLHLLLLPCSFKVKDMNIFKEFQQLRSHH